MKKITKSKIFMIIGISILIVAISGSAYAYYAASTSANISGYAAGASMSLTVTELSTSATGNLIPLDNDVTTLNKATLGYGNSSGYNASKACIDKNGYSVCKTYEITLTNTGNAPLTVNGGVSLFGSNTPNLDCANMTDKVTVTSNSSCKGKTTLANNVTINAGASNKYYIVVYINNINENQNDSGSFSGTVTFTSTAGGKLKAKFADDVNAAEYITGLYTNSTKTAVTHTGENITYQYDTTHNLMNDNHDNIRYFGANPNNYVDIGDVYEVDSTISYESYWVYLEASTEAECLALPTTYCPSMYEEWEFSSESDCEENFYTVLNQFIYLSLTSNEEFCTGTPIEAGTSKLYRIVGVFDNKIKIVRNESIGRYSWNVSPTSDKWSNFSNEWSQADLMKLLNPNYENNSYIDSTNAEKVYNNSLYWNSAAGECYDGHESIRGVKLVSCDFTNTGLNANVHNMIDVTTWNTGGWSSGSIYSTAMYNYERGTNLVSNPSDGITRQATWTGKVGLLYPSDYGYSTDFRYCDETLNGYSNDENCQNYTWICKSVGYGDGIALLTPSSNYSGEVYYIIGPTGYVDLAAAYLGAYIYPTMYLNSDVIVESGNGTEDNPYKLSL